MKLSAFFLTIYLFSSCADKSTTVNQTQEKNASLTGKWELMFYTFSFFDKNGTLTDLKDDGKMVTGWITNEHTNKREKVNRVSQGLMALELNENKSYIFRTPLENGEYKIDEGTWQDVSKSPKYKSGDKILFGTKLKKSTRYNKEGIVIDSMEGMFAGSTNIYEVISNDGKKLEIKMFYKTGIEGKDYPKTVMTFRKI